MKSKESFLDTCFDIKEELNGLKNDDYEDSTTDLDELSDEFLTTTLKLVDELCDNIRNGDPDIGRTREVNQKLNSAITCYRVKLFDKTQVHLVLMIIQGFVNQKLVNSYKIKFFRNG